MQTKVVVIEAHSKDTGSEWLHSAWDTKLTGRAADYARRLAALHSTVEYKLKTVVPDEILPPALASKLYRARVGKSVLEIQS